MSKSSATGGIKGFESPGRANKVDSKGGMGSGIGSLREGRDRDVSNSNLYQNLNGQSQNMSSFSERLTGNDRGNQSGLYHTNSHTSQHNKGLGSRFESHGSGNNASPNQLRESAPIAGPPGLTNSPPKSGLKSSQLTSSSPRRSPKTQSQTKGGGKQMSASAAAFTPSPNTVNAALEAMQANAQNKLHVMASSLSAVAFEQLITSASDADLSTFYEQAIEVVAGTSGLNSNPDVDQIPKVVPAEAQRRLRAIRSELQSRQTAQTYVEQLSCQMAANEQVRCAAAIA